MTPACLLISLLLTSGLVTVQPLEHGGTCVTPQHLADRQQIVADWFAARPAALRGTPAPLTFYPLGGNLYRDIWMGNFVDLDPGPGAFDFDCTDYAGNGHRGSDAGPRWFGEQEIGVAVFAAADGVVIATNDGEDDHNVSGSATPGNYVFIDHGGGQIGYYYHLRKFSVAVSPTDTVVAGQQIGMAASSGNSFGPHLHFELERDGVTYEPFAGACRPGPSGWSNQTPLDRSHFLWDFGITHEDLSTFPWWPFTFPRGGQIAMSDPFLEFWILGAGLPANTTWRVQFQRPDGVVTLDSTTIPYGNPTPFQWYLTWWHYNLVDIPDIQTTPGTWKILFDIDGVRMIDAPFEVRPARTAGFNRPPANVTVAFDPPAPTPGQALVARVDAERGNDDPDYDIVRFRYEWRVNGALVRDVTTAGQADVLARDQFGTCDLVEVSVTPGDGLLNAATTTIAAPATGCVGDTNGDGLVDLSDLATLLAGFGQQAGATPADGDTDCDGDIDLSDLAALLSRFGAGCS